MRLQTVVSLQVCSTAGKVMFIANKGYQGLLFHEIGSALKVADHDHTVANVDWDADLTLVRVALEPIALDDEAISTFRRDWELWGGKIYEVIE